MAFHELLRVRSVKHVEQNAFDGGVSHRGFPVGVDCMLGRVSKFFIPMALRQMHQPGSSARSIYISFSHREPSSQMNAIVFPKSFRIDLRELA